MQRSHLKGKNYIITKRWEKIQEIKETRSKVKNERERQTLICERIPSEIDLAHHGFHDFYYISFINIRNIKRKVLLYTETEDDCSKNKRTKTSASSILFPVLCLICDKENLWISEKSGKRKKRHRRAGCVALLQSEYGLDSTPPMMITKKVKYLK